MIRALKYEISYYKYYLITLIIFILIYTLFSLNDLQLTTSAIWEIDYWGGIYSLLLYGYLLIVWGNRIRENRIRLQSLLPISIKHQSMVRFWLASVHYIIILPYLIIANLLVIDGWHQETGSMIGQIGITIILFAGFIRGRDDWFSHWNLGKRFSAAFVTVLIIQIILVAVFTMKPEFNKELVSAYGSDAFNYANLIFSLLGFSILITTIFSYRKRRSYLT